MRESLQVCRLGLIDYREAWDLQGRLAAARRAGALPNLLLLLQHPHTYTLGRSGKPEHVLLSPGELERYEIGLYEVDRGGDVTYHGPEQLVGYPILKIGSGRFDYVRYIRDVEHALLLAVQDLGAPAELKRGLSGVWVGDEKVCAIGVKVDAHGVTSHGFALNVNTDLSYFGHIIPCGIADKGVTSLAQVLRRRVSMRRVEDAVVRRMAERFDLALEPRALGRGRLERMVAAEAAGTMGRRA